MREIMYREALREAMAEEMKKDEHLFLLAYDVGKYGGEHRISGDLYHMYGDLRVKDAPISEQGIVGCGIGAAITGCRSIVEIPFMDFMPMCMDMIVNQAAKFYHMFGGQMNVPMVILTSVGGYIRAAQQHSQCLEAWVAHVPGLKTVMPSTPYDAKGLLKAAINDPNPVVFIEHKKLLPMKGEVPEEEYEIPIGKAEIKRAGKDVTVVATSYTVHLSLQAAENMEKKGVSVEVVDLRTLVPLDKETILNSVKKTTRLVIVHEAHVTGGFGGEIAAIVADEAFGYLDAPIKRVGAKWTPIPFPSVMEDYVLPGVADIEAAIQEVVIS
jgi:pyruvate/2-oxoglutarate/acetoin dehydrogenase E1 component